MAISDLAAKAAAQHQETVRLNTEHAQAVVLAPAKWEDFKSEFNAECDSITRAGAASFQCKSTDALTFQVEKLVRGTLHRAIDFTFHPSVPAISFTRHFEKQYLKMGSLQLTMCGPHLVYTSGGIGVRLSDFVQQCMMPLLGW